MSKVAYVIGGFGFLGGRLVPSLLAQGWRVGAIDPAAPATGIVAIGAPGASVEAVRDGVSPESLSHLEQALGKPAVVFHLGGSGSVGAAAADPEGDRERTVDSTRLLARTVGPDARLVLVSSAAVYGDGAEGPIPEEHAPAPISVYGTHKAQAEAIATVAPSLAIVRFFSIYGPGLRKQLLWDACHKLRRGDLEFAGTGQELRDWLHVDDAVALLQRVAEGRGQLVVNGGSGRATTVAAAISTLGTALGVAEAPRFSGAARAGDPRSLVAGIARAGALGWTPSVAVEEGIAAYARWFAAQSC